MSRSAATRLILQNFEPHQLLMSAAALLLWKARIAVLLSGPGQRRLPPRAAEPVQRVPRQLLLFRKLLLHALSAIGGEPRPVQNDIRDRHHHKVRDE